MTSYLEAYKGHQVSAEKQCLWTDRAVYLVIYNIYTLTSYPHLMSIERIAFSTEGGVKPFFETQQPLKGNNIYFYEIYTAQNIKRNTACFAIDHNTTALIVRLIARVGLIRRKHVCPVISLVTDQGQCFLIKMK